MAEVDAVSSVDTWFVYILRCADGSLYTGITKDVDRQLKQHNAGTASRYTRGRLPVSLEYQEEQPNQSIALKYQRFVSGNRTPRRPTETGDTCAPVTEGVRAHVT